MIYIEPDLRSEDHVVMEMIQSQRQRLRTSTQNSPKKWTGDGIRITDAGRAFLDQVPEFE